MADESLHKFPTTRWSVIFDARSEDSSERHRALEDLCRIYWPPLYAYARRSGQSPADAEDLTQGFLASLLRRERFQVLEEQDAKLRSFLLHAFKQFIIDEHRKSEALKRGGEFEHFSIHADDAEERVEISDASLSPDEVFQRNWAITLLGQAARTLQERYVKKGKEELFGILFPFVDSGKGNYEEASAAAGFDVPTLRVYVSRMRDEFQKAVRAELADSVGPGVDVDEELRELQRVFAA